eukprot:1159907-Pelagomonas_calceolata.AAC.3
MRPGLKLQKRPQILNQIGGDIKTKLKGDAAPGQVTRGRPVPIHLEKTCARGQAPHCCLRHRMGPACLSCIIAFMLAIKREGKEAVPCEVKPLFLKVPGGKLETLPQQRPLQRALMLHSLFAC